MVSIKLRSWIVSQKIIVSTTLTCKCKIIIVSVRFLVSQKTNTHLHISCFRVDIAGHIYTLMTVWEKIKRKTRSILTSIDFESTGCKQDKQSIIQIPNDSYYKPLNKCSFILKCLREVLQMLNYNISPLKLWVAGVFRNFQLTSNPYISSFSTRLFILIFRYKTRCYINNKTWKQFLNRS